MKKLHLPRLGRKGKIVRNLLLCLPLIGYLWVEGGCRMPTAEMEFRRAERRNLLPPSEIIFWKEDSGGWKGLELPGYKVSITGWRDGVLTRAMVEGGSVHYLFCSPRKYRPFTPSW